MLLIETQHKRIPWRWVMLLTLMGQSRILVLFAAVSMTFTMRKFIESPLILNSVSSLDILFNLLIAGLLFIVTGLLFISLSFFLRVNFNSPQPKSNCAPAPLRLVRRSSLRRQ